MSERSISDLASHCIRCGFCLEACPTFVITGEETASPRGRIYLIRSADEGTLDWEETRRSLDPCLGCRACETACPSGVEYGALLELAREKLVQRKPEPAKKLFLNALTNPNLARIQFALGGLLPGRKMPDVLSKRLSGSPAEATLPVPQPSQLAWSPLASEGLPPVRGHVVLLEGCAMRVLFPRVHEATRRLLRRVGYEVAPIDLGCCGALHAHAGYLAEGHHRAERVRVLAKGLPVIVNSAGCGSWLKDTLSAPGSSGQGVRWIFDLVEFLNQEGLDLTQANRLRGTSLTYHDACHLSHGQRITEPPRRLIAQIPGTLYTELPESDRCCGSAGVYNLTQPLMARKLLERKFDFIESTKATLVATGNPGCHAWIEQAARERGGRVRILHTAELLESAFSGLPDQNAPASTRP